VTIRQGKTFQLGTVTFKNPIYLAMDLSDRNVPPGEKRAGVVGGRTHNKLGGRTKI